jgi:hypothetical protein
MKEYVSVFQALLFRIIFFSIRRVRANKAYLVPQGIVLDSGQRGEATLSSSDIVDQAILTAPDE